MRIFDLKKKKDIRIIKPEDNLPEDLERFKLPPRELPKPEREGYMPKELKQNFEKSEKIDKLDLVLQKLDTIDARLRLIEEKLR